MFQFSEEQKKEELRCRRRNKGESLRELAHDIRRLMTLAYPGEQSSLSEHIARDAFLSALGDPDFELKIREREPTDLDGALAIAQRYEVFKGAVESSAATRPRLNRFVTEVQCDEVSLTEDDRGVSRRQDPVNGTLDVSTRKWCAKSENTGETHWKEDVMRRLGNLESAKQEVEQQAERLTAENAALIKEVDRLRYLEQLRAAPTHQSNDQVQRPVDVSASAPPSRAVRMLGPCFRCGQMGHLQRHCPLRSKVQHNYEVADRYQAQAKSASRSTEQNMSAATYLRARVGKRVCNCLLDTGSDVTVIPASLVCRDDIKDTVHTLSAANGTEIAVIGEVSLPFSIGEFRGMLTGLVSEHVGEVMLGIDWMVSNSVTWEFDRSRIKIGKKYYGLKRRSDNRAWCRRVVLQGDVVIPSRTEVDLPTAVVVRRLSDDVGKGGLDWGTEPRPLVPGVHVSRTVIPGDRLSSIPVRAMNVRSEDVVLKAGTAVSDLNPVTVLGCFPTAEVAETQVENSNGFGKKSEEHLRVAAERRKTSYDIKTRDVEFGVGEWVWYWYPRKYPSRSPKWQRSYTGPYLIVRKIEPVNVVLQRSPRSKPFVVHINKIKKCFGETPESWLNSEIPSTQAAVSGTPDLGSSDRGNEMISQESGNHIAHGHSTDGRRYRRPPRYLSDYHC